MSAVRGAAVLVVGDELLAGVHPDLNTPAIARSLAAVGVEVHRAALVGDREEEIAEALEALLRRESLVLVSGGLGPTLDDVTREGVARAFGRRLVEDADVLAGLEHWFAARGLAMPEPNRRQARLPEGAVLLDNRVGTAPGFRIEGRGGVVVALPGPPRELAVVLEEEVVPWLRASARAGGTLDEHRFFLFGLTESGFAERAGAWMARDAEPLMGCSAKEGVLSVTLRVRRPERARGLLTERVAAFRERFRDHVFSEEDDRLETALGRALLSGGVSVTAAESCTGGLVCALLTRVPGISAVFGRGFVTYSDEAKRELLGVPAALLERHGAVSREVVEAMAAGAARASGARLSLAITGIAGPGGGSAGKPVGLVWLATSLDGRVSAVSRTFPPRDRDWIRVLAANTALHAGWRRLRADGGASGGD